MEHDKNIWGQLRYLQTLNSISAENNSTIVFPVPIDIMSELLEKKVNKTPDHHMKYALLYFTGGLIWGNVGL